MAEGELYHFGSPDLLFHISSDTIIISPFREQLVVSLAGVWYRFSELGVGWSRSVPAGFIVSDKGVCTFYSVGDLGRLERSFAMTAHALH